MTIIHHSDLFKPAPGALMHHRKQWHGGKGMEVHRSPSEHGMSCRQPAMTVDQKTHNPNTLSLLDLMRILEQEMESTSYDFHSLVVMVIKQDQWLEKTGISSGQNCL